MVELRIVRFVDDPHAITAPAIAERFAAVKTRTLDYVEGKLLRKDLPGESSAIATDLGAVRSWDDAHRLLSAVEAEFPGQPFTIEVERHAWAGGVVWYPSDLGG